MTGSTQRLTRELHRRKEYKWNRFHRFLLYNYERLDSKLDTVVTQQMHTKTNTYSGRTRVHFLVCE